MATRAQELPWTEVPNLERTNETTTPIPDLTYGFPIYTKEHLGKAGVSEGYLGSDGIANFSFDFLETLRKNEIITSPAKGAMSGNETVSKSRSDHLICFPWAVVEVKRDEDSNTHDAKCYCQAANASAAALALQESLVERLYDTPNHYIFPIIAFTCIGPKIRTWLAYSTYERGKTITVRIRMPNK